MISLYKGYHALIKEKKETCENKYQIDRKIDYTLEKCFKACEENDICNFFWFGDAKYCSLFDRCLTLHLDARLNKGTTYELDRGNNTRIVFILQYAIK